MLEIERKFLVNWIPENAIILQTKLIEQNYLVIGDEELRIRKIVNDDGKEKMYIGFKKGTGLVREEFEKEISQDTYKQLSGMITTKPIIKVRKMFKISNELNDILYEYDEYKNEELNGLQIVEIEFKDVPMSEKFIIPNWIDKEVTSDKKYKNQNIWKLINKLI
jgi:adenylate cyclase